MHGKKKRLRHDEGRRKNAPSIPAMLDATHDTPATLFRTSETTPRGDALSRSSTPRRRSFSTVAGLPARARTCKGNETARG